VVAAILGGKQGVFICQDQVIERSLRRCSEHEDRNEPLCDLR